MCCILAKVTPVVLLLLSAKSAVAIVPATIPPSFT